MVTLAGERYRRAGRRPGYARWTAQRGWVSLGRPEAAEPGARVRTRWANAEVHVQTDHRFQEPPGMDEKLWHRVSVGFSCGQYRECAEAVPENM